MLHTQVQYNGLTPLGSQLDAKVVRPFVAGAVQSRTLQKPVLARILPLAVRMEMKWSSDPGRAAFDANCHCPAQQRL